jgi:hypothetical protein
MTDKRLIPSTTRGRGDAGMRECAYAETRGGVACTLPLSGNGRSRPVILLLLLACVVSTASAQELEVRLRLNKTPDQAYAEGEKILISVDATRDCYLQLLYRDAANRNWLIYPNAGSPSGGVIKGGETVTLGKGVEIDGFEFEVTPPFGGEMIRAYASTKPLKRPEGRRAEGMIEPTKSMDALDVFYHDEAARVQATFTNATVLLKTVPKAIASRDDAADRPAGSETSPAGFNKPRIFGLVVGVTSYASPAIKPLRYADADARLVAEFLSSAEGAGIPSDQLRVLINEEATRANILDACRSFLAQTVKSDIVILYFAGHGMTSPQANATYFLGHDADVKNLAATGVDQAELTTLLSQNVKAGKIVFFIDACHGGGLGLTGVRLRGANTVLSAKLLTELVSKKNGTAFFSASRAMEQSQEGPSWGGGHGVFTHHLVAGLRRAADLNGDGRVTIDELAEYVTGKVKEDTGGKQHPELKGYFDNDLVLSVLK